MFWRETGIKDEEEEVEARDGACSMETAMGEAWVLCARSCRACGDQREQARYSGRARPARQWQGGVRVVYAVLFVSGVAMQLKWAGEACEWFARAGSRSGVVRGC